VLEKLLNKVKAVDLLVLLIVILGNIIIVFALVVKLYPQLILTVFQSNDYYLIGTTGILILILAAFVGSVQLYVGRGIVKWTNRRKQEKERKKVIRNLPPLYKVILSLLMLDQSLNVYDPQISSALSDLERLGFVQRSTKIPPTYHVHVAYYAFFRENPGLLMFAGATTDPRDWASDLHSNESE
jgi:hypothetical protein